LGNVQGNVDASDKLEVRRDATLVGDIKTPRIVIEDGAYFKRSIDIVKPEPAKTSASVPKPQVKPVAAVAPANSQSAAMAGELGEDPTSDLMCSKTQSRN